jgi:putative transposase
LKQSVLTRVPHNASVMSSARRTLGPHRHVVLMLDRAGWHVAKALEVPPNITLLHLPPYSPEPNPVDRLWAFLKSHCLRNRVFTDYNDLFAAVRAALLQLLRIELHA